MNILVFDTCFNKTYIVLKNDDKILSDVIVESNKGNYHSVFLIPKIKSILNNNNLSIKDIDAIGVNIGPGSFTGIRTGITIARVLCQQFNAKLIGVSSLRILSGLVDGDSVAVLDARKNKVYFAEYLNNKELISPCLIEKDELLNRILSKAVISDSSVCAFLSDNGINSINFEQTDNNLGIYLSEIVSDKLKTNNNDFNWAGVKPLYIQPPSITKPKVNADV